MANRLKIGYLLKTYLEKILWVNENKLKKLFFIPILCCMFTSSNNKTLSKMKNLTLPQANQIESEIQKYCQINGPINLNNLYHYLKYAKQLIMLEFKSQGVDFNSDDFFKIYRQYTASETYFKFVIL